MLFSKHDNEGVASAVRRVAKENVQGTHMGGAEEALFVGSCVYAPEAMRSFTLSARLHWALASTGAELCLWVSSGQYSSAARDPCMLLQTCSAHASQMVQSSLQAHSKRVLWAQPLHALQKRHKTGWHCVGIRCRHLIHEQAIQSEAVAPSETHPGLLRVFPIARTSCSFMRECSASSSSERDGTESLLDLRPQPNPSYASPCNSSS